MAVDTHMAIMRLNCVFKNVCVKVWNQAYILSLQEDVAITLCMFKKNSSKFLLYNGSFGFACGRSLWASS